MTPATESNAEPKLRAARRLMVVGCSGAGKSTFSKQIADLLDLPVIHLDNHFWKPGWIETPDPEWDDQVEALARQDEWVMDGNYSRTIHHRLPRADVVILLDVPAWQCIWSVYQRSFRFRGETRPDLPEGCPEQMPDRQFLWWILSYRWRSRPKVLRAISNAPHATFYRLRSRRAMRRFIAELSSQTPPA